MQLGLPDDNIYILYDGCILKYPFSQRFDADFTRMTFPDGTVVIVNSPFFQDKLWFLICWAKLTIDGQSTVLIMKDFSFRYMLTLVPEAVHVVRSTHGEK